MIEFTEILDDKATIEHRMKHGSPILCMYLNPALPKTAICRLSKSAYVVQVWRKNVKQRAVLVGCYKEKRPRDFRHDHGTSQYFEELLRREALYLLLRETIPEEILIGFLDVYETATVAHNHKDRFAIVCDMYTENKNAVWKPEIGWQNWNWREN